jgi:rRNA maturation protein Nop10
LNHSSAFRATSPDNEDMKTKEAYVLTLICPRCGKRFVSSMPLDPPTLATIRLTNVLERCSACGDAARFRKDDNVVRSGRNPGGVVTP